MKKTKSALALSLAILMGIGVVRAEDKEFKSPYEFIVVKKLPATSVKDQNRSGTCWSFSGQSFLESEIMRQGGDSLDLSEMFVVRHAYHDKSVRNVRMHGTINYGPGGAFHDVLEVFKNYGAIPEESYHGIACETKGHVHGEMDAMLQSEVKAVISNKNKTLTPVWPKVIDATLDAYLGEVPESFDYKGTNYTPQSFARDYCKINPEDYVEIGSYTHHPFYSQFVLEVQDNWTASSIYNVPLDDLRRIISNAIDNGYTVAWGADVSDPGFATKTLGVAVVPDIDKKEMNDAEIAKWEKLSSKDKSSQEYKFFKPGHEKTITQEMRQKAFDNYDITDDHGMHIIGKAKDKEGNLYYIVKNSWNKYNKYDGYFYASQPYVDLRTIDIMIHKDAIPKDIRKKLEIK